MSSNHTPENANSKKRARVEEVILVESVELEKDPKRVAPLPGADPSLETQIEFETYPFESTPLDDDIMEAFELEEEAQIASQRTANSIPSQIPSFVDLTHSDSENVLPDTRSANNIAIKAEKSSQEPISSTSSKPSPVVVKPEHLDRTTVKSEPKESTPQPETMPYVLADDSRSEITVDISPAPVAAAVPQRDNVPPSFIDVVSNELEWASLATSLDSRRDNFSKIVGVGVVFSDGSSNFYADHRTIDPLEYRLPDWKAVGYGLSLSGSKSLPVFIRLDSASSGEPISMDARWNLLSTLFLNPDIRKYVFNSKDAFKPFLRRDRTFRPVNVQDPQLAAWVLSPELFVDFGFSEVCAHFIKDKPLANYSPYMNLARDIMLSMSLGASLEPQLVSEQLWDVFLKNEMPLPPLLALMEIDGITFNNEQLVNSERQLHEMLRDLEKLAARVCGFPVNLASPKQVADVIFNKIGLRPPKNKERKVSSGRESTTEFILKAVSKQHPLPDIVLRYRRVMKFQSNWVASLNRRRVQGRLFSHWSQTAAATGRVISSKPNLQNLPRASLILDAVCTDRIGSIALETIAPSLVASRALPSISVRSSFVAEPGNVFISADFSQLEMRLLAHVSQETSLIDFFLQGKDIHALVASKWKGIPLDQVTNDDRTAAKRLVYGIMYGMGPYSLADHLDVGIDVAKKFLNQFLAAYPAVQQFVERTKILARTRGWVRTLFGRRRLLHYEASIVRDYEGLDFEEDDESMDVLVAETPISTHLADVKRPDRQAVNSVIQGTAADIVKCAMVRIDEELQRGYPSEKDGWQAGEPAAKLRLQIHDELLYECPAEAATRVAQVIKRNMEHVVAFSVPLTVQVRVGTNWGEMKYFKVAGETSAMPPRVPLGFTDASYAIEPSNTDTSFGPTATHSTTEGPATANTSVTSKPKSHDDADKLFELL